MLTSTKNPIGLALHTAVHQLRNSLRAAFLLMVFSWNPQGVLADALTLDEYTVMAIYTYNFAKFTQWPAQTFANAAAPLNLCIFGENPFGITLSVVEGKKVRGRTLLVKHYQRVAVITDCHIMFISQSEHRRLGSIINSLAAIPILTVSEISDFSRRGGMITLFRADRRIRFMINPEAVRRAGLKVSSELLRLALIVTENKVGDRD